MALTATVLLAALALIGDTVAVPLAADNTTASDVSVVPKGTSSQAQTVFTGFSSDSSSASTDLPGSSVSTSNPSPSSTSSPTSSPVTAQTTPMSSISIPDASSLSTVSPTPSAATAQATPSSSISTTSSSSTSIASPTSSLVTSQASSSSMASSTSSFVIAQANPSSSALDSEFFTVQDTVLSLLTSIEGALTSSVDSSSSTSTTTTVSTVFQSASTVTVTASPQTVTDTITIVPPPTPSSTIGGPTAWTAPPQMTDLSAFSIQKFAYGKNNLRLIVSDPPEDDSSDPSSGTLTGAAVAVYHAVDAGLVPAPPKQTESSFLQLYYPANSINPGQEPQGGADFYATPLDLSRARNVSLEYSVFFPLDFDWVLGGKVPGMYGGHNACSGGDDALYCFSTRLMWRAKGAGELYLYVPKDRQTAALCETSPESVCDADYGFSIGRGAFHFAAGNWTHIKQTVVLNTPGQQDGGFALDVNGQRVIDRSDIFYRDDPSADPDADPDTGSGDGGGLLGDLFNQTAGNLKYKVDSVLSDVTARARVARDFTPKFAPASYWQPDIEFTPEFAPDWDVFPGTGVSHLAPIPVDNATVTTTTTTTIVLPTSTVTLAPTTTETAYVMAMETALPFSPIKVTAPEPVGFTGLFFSTFFGGHEPKFATPKDQFSWYKDFSMTIND